MISTQVDQFIHEAEEEAMYYEKAIYYRPNSNDKTGYSDNKRLNQEEVIVRILIASNGHTLCLSMVRCG